MRIKLRLLGQIRCLQLLAELSKLVAHAGKIVEQMLLHFGSLCPRIE